MSEIIISETPGSVVIEEVHPTLTLDHHTVSIQVLPSAPSIVAPTEELTHISIVEEPPQIVVEREYDVTIATIAEAGPAGPPGPTGNTGPPGSAATDKYYTHIQSVVSDMWLVTHNLNKKPSVTVVDSADSVVIGETQYIDDNNLVIGFSAEFSGKAYIN